MNENETNASPIVPPTAEAVVRPLNISHINRYAVKTSMGQFWIVDTHADSRILAMSPNEKDADNIAHALSIWVRLP